MTTLQISLADNLKQFIEDQAARSGYSSPSAYVEALIEEVRRTQSDATLEGELLKGLDSGSPTEVDDAYWVKFRARMRARLRKEAV
jgi:antitoxin ParD1/3/4